MIGLGTIINCGSVLAGASAGMLLKNGLSKRFEDTIMQASACAPCSSASAARSAAC